MMRVTPLASSTLWATFGSVISATVEDVSNATVGGALTGAPVSVQPTTVSVTTTNSPIPRRMFDLRTER
jgi:hypothetical protein